MLKDTQKESSLDTAEETGTVCCHHEDEKQSACNAPCSITDCDGSCSWNEAYHSEPHLCRRHR